jgi:hypothetical protein
MGEAMMTVATNEERTGGPIPEPPATEPPRARPALRIRIGSLLALAAAIAPLIAQYVVIGRTPPHITHLINSWTLTVVLAGVAVGLVRRTSWTGMMIQIGLASSASVAFVEANGTDWVVYLLPGYFAIGIVCPLLIRRIAEAQSTRWKERVQAPCQVALNSFFTFTVAILMTFVNVILGEFGFGAPPPPYPVPSYSAAVEPPPYGAAPAPSPLPIVPGSVTQPSAGPVSRPAVPDGPYRGPEPALVPPADSDDRGPEPALVPPADSDDRPPIPKGPSSVADRR